MLDDFYLHPEEWVDMGINEQNETELKVIVEQSFSETTIFMENIFEKFLKIFWEDQRIDFSIFTDEKLLADPIDSIQYSLEHLVYQKQLFQESLPFILDKQLLRINSRRIRSFLQNFPSECLHKLYFLMPNHIKKIAEELSEYLS